MQFSVFTVGWFVTAYQRFACLLNFNRLERNVSLGPLGLPPPGPLTLGCYCCHVFDLSEVHLYPLSSHGLLGAPASYPLLACIVLPVQAGVVSAEIPLACEKMKETFHFRRKILPAQRLNGDQQRRNVVHMIAISFDIISRSVTIFMMLIGTQTMTRHYSMSSVV